MAATLDRQAERSLEQARVAESAQRVAVRVAREDRIRFIRDAKAAGWTWARMGRELEISEAAVRRFWHDNRMIASRLGGTDEGEQQSGARAPIRSHQPSRLLDTGRERAMG